jgi:ankyrin repeat protein
MGKNTAAANDNTQQTPDQRLLAAAEAGDLEKVKACLAEGADINTRNAGGDTPLILAVREGQDGVIAELLAQNADATLHNNQGKTVLHVAFREATAKNHLKDLVAAAAPARDKQDMHKATAAFYAAQTNNLPALDLLIAAKADLTLRNKDDTPPLLWATQLSHTAAVAKILDGGVSPDEADSRGMTGMMHAANLGNEELVALYLTRNANAEKRAEDGRRAQDFAHARGATGIADRIDESIARRYASIHDGMGATIVPMKRLQLRPRKGGMTS